MKRALFLVPVGLCLSAHASAQVATQRTGYQVTLTSTPSGAQIWLGTRNLGQTPWTGYLRAGTWTVNLRLNGYAARSKALAVRRVRSIQRYHAELQATGGVLAIAGSDELAGALVYVDDEKSGTLTADGFRKVLAPGRYLIRVQKVGYRPAHWWATLRQGRETNRTVTLVREHQAVPLTLPARCTAAFRADQGEAEAGGNVTHLDPPALERAARADHTLRVTCAPEPSAPITAGPHEVVIEAQGGQLHIEGDAVASPARRVIPEGTTTLRLAITPPKARYQPPTRLAAGAYALALDAGFPRMLGVALRVGTGRVLHGRSSLETGTYLLGNRLAAHAAAHWQPWSTGAWSASFSLGLEAGAGFMGAHSARFAELDTGVELAATFSRVSIVVGAELQLWGDLLCPRGPQCPSGQSLAVQLEEHNVTPARLSAWQWNARPVLTLTAHTALQGPWALASSLRAAFQPRATYLGAFGALLPSSDPLVYLQVGFRRTF